MPRLTTERYLQARAFLNDRARPLELALFEHDFEDAPAWPVLDALAAFQNDDGGFGHGLEPDAVTPTSGALATSLALRFLAEVGTPNSHPMLRAATRYLEDSFDHESSVWRIVPEDTESHPHAPWWSQVDLAERFNGYELNPKAEIVAHLQTLVAPVDREWLKEQVRLLVDEVEAAATGPGELEMHDLIGACRLLDAKYLAAETSRRLRQHLEKLVRAGLADGTSGGYGLRASDVAPRPGSALADVVADVIPAELEELLAGQSEDGAWWPQWDWGAEPGSGAAQAWAASRSAWAGMLTLENLRILNAHGLIDRG